MSNQINPLNYKRCYPRHRLFHRIEGLKKPIPAFPSTHGFQYLESLFHGDRFAGVYTHIFQACEVTLYHLLEAHGVQFHPDLTLHDNRVMLLQHLIHGNCFRDPEDAKSRTSSHIKLVGPFHGTKNLRLRSRPREAHLKVCPSKPAKISLKSAIFSL